MSSYLHKTEPYQHQDRAVYFMFERFMRKERYGALFMEQGTGKTKVAIDIASNLFLAGNIKAVMVVAPNGVQNQWNDEELPLHSPIPFSSFVWEGLSTKRKIKETFEFIKTPDKNIKWFFVNAEAFSYGTHLGLFQEFLTMNDSLHIMDEATLIKTPDSNRTINLTQGMSDVLKEGKRVISFTPYSKYRLILTGTQVTNSPFDLWAMMEFLQHDFFGRDYFSFCGHHGVLIQSKAPEGAKKDKYYRKITPSEMKSIRNYVEAGKDYEEVSHIMKISESSVKFLVDNPTSRVPYKHLDELKQKIATVAFQVRKIDCLDLPPKTYSKRVVTMSGDQAKAYEDLENDMLATYGNMTLTAFNHLSLGIRLQQVTGGFFPCGLSPEGEWLDKPVAFKSNAKLDELMHQFDETDDYPIIVPAIFIPEVKLIVKTIEAKRPDLTVDCIYGDVNLASRTAIRERFNRKELDVLVANPKTIRFGFNLQVCHTMISYSSSYSFEDRSQLEDRIHRNGQLSDKVLYKDLIARGTLDENIYRALQSHKDLLDFMRDTNMTFKQFVGG